MIPHARLVGLMTLSLLPVFSTQANERIDQMDIPGTSQCPPLMTEAECQTHHRILSSLANETERRAYLGMHDQLMTDRLAACGCSRAANRLGMRQN